MLLQKKNKNDNLSKELEASKYTLDDLPSLQICKEKNLIVHTKGCISCTSHELLTDAITALLALGFLASDAKEW